jgi:hypothetical protein
MSNYNELLNLGEEEISNYYSNITTSANNNNASLMEVEQKNSMLFDKEKIQMELLMDIQNKEKLLLTRSRMLQISQDRNSYKKKLIYLWFSSSIIIFILIIVIYIIVSKRR